MDYFLLNLNFVCSYRYRVYVEYEIKIKVPESLLYNFNSAFWHRWLNNIHIIIYTLIICRASWNLTCQNILYGTHAVFFHKF